MKEEYCPKPGDRIRVDKRGKYGTTPQWAYGYRGEVLRVNRSGTVTIRLDEYPDEKHYADPRDLRKEDQDD